MNMYSDLLSSVFEDWVDELTGAALVDYALVCRVEMLTPRSTGSASDALAAEIAYDRALIKLCAARDIVVDVTAFARPRPERERLERALAAVGLDLVALSRKEASA